MIETNTYREIVVSCTCFVGKKVLSHAGTFLRQENSKGELSALKFYDPNENHFFERGEHSIDYRRLFSRYGLITVLALRGRPVKNDAEKEFIFNTMTRIMTEKDNSEYIKAK